MPPQPQIQVLIDSCSFTFWRATATLSWWGRSQPDTPPSSDNEELMSRLRSQYLKSLDTVRKEVGVKPKDMLLVRDCPHAKVWRRAHYPKYKHNRDDCGLGEPSKYGSYIKHLNETMADEYLDIIRVDEAEADDIIAVLTRYYKHQDPDSQIVIVANDSDYDQLLRYSGVRIYNPKAKSWVVCDDPKAALERKISKGDASDCVPAGLPKHLKRLLIDMSCIPRNIQDRIMTAYMSLPSHTQPPLKCLQYHPMPIQLGLCCINTGLQKRKIICSSTLRLHTLEQKGLAELEKIARNNCNALIKHLQWNAENGIRVFRMSSDLFPHKNNPKAPHYTFDFAKDLIQKAAQIAHDTGQRLTFHPGQYDVVCAEDDSKFQNCAADLDWHAELLDLMGCGPDSVIVVHAGALYIKSERTRLSDKERTKKRWITNFYRLSERVQRRLVLENCEKCFSITDCLDVSNGWTDLDGNPVEGCQVPVVLDTHHYDCYVQMHPKEQLQPLAECIPGVLATWSRRHIKPKMHISQGCPDSSNICKHSDLISEVPKELLEIPALYGVNIDIMVEAKLKEQAIELLWQVHPELDPRTSAKPPETKAPETKIRPKLRSQPKLGGNACVEFVPVVKLRPKLKVIMV
jgi:UV DNA damage endonuclease